MKPRHVSAYAMTTKEPSGAAQLAARLARAYPSLSAYSSATLAEELCAIERAQRRHAERCCSGEDGGYVRLRNPQFGMVSREHDPDAEARAEKRIQHRRNEWLHRLQERTSSPLPMGMCGVSITLQDDPRGPVLLLQLPGEGEAVAV